MTKEHTPTPWVAIKGDWEPWGGAIEISSGDYTIAYTTSGGNEEMDAAHIVKCVNMHDELMQALEWLEVYAKVQVKRFPMADDSDGWKKVLSSLAKARGEV